MPPPRWFPAFHHDPCVGPVAGTTTVPSASEGTSYTFLELSVDERPIVVVSSRGDTQVQGNFMTGGTLHTEGHLDVGGNGAVGGNLTVRGSVVAGPAVSAAESLTVADVFGVSTTGSSFITRRLGSGTQ